MGAHGAVGRGAERLHLGLIGLLQAALAAELVLQVAQGAWVFVLIVVVTMGLVILPLAARSGLGIPMPASFLIATTLFFYAACVPGEVWNFYGRLWWWDLLMHLTSGFLLAVFGFLLLRRDGRPILPPGMTALFAFTFALGCAAVWELFEFTLDRVFDTTMQRPMLGDPSGLTDTMIDLMLDGVGALAPCAHGWLRLRQGRLPFVARGALAPGQGGATVPG